MRFSLLYLNRTNVDSSSISSLSPSSSSSSITAYFSAVDEGDGGDNTPKKHPPSLPAGRTTFPMMTLRSQYQHPFKPPSSLPISVRGEKNYRASNYRTFATTSSSLATSRFVTGDGQANTPQHFLVPPPPRNPGIFLPSSGEESSAGDYDDDNSTLQFRKLPSITLSLEVLEDGQPLEGNNENNSPHVNLSILRAENVDRLFQLLEEQEEKAESLPFDEALENFDHQLEQILVRIFKSSKEDNAEEELGNLEQQQFPRRNSDDEELLAETPVVPVRNPSCVDFLGLRSGEGIQLKQSDFPLRVSLHGVITNRGKEEKQVRWPLGYAILPRMDLWEMEIDEAMESLERAFDGNDDDDNSRKRKRRKRRRRRNATNNVTRKLVLHPTTTKKEQWYWLTIWEHLNILRALLKTFETFVLSVAELFGCC